jgi:hypothetical protein
MRDSYIDQLQISQCCSVMPTCHERLSVVTSSGDGGVEEMVLSPQRILILTTKLPENIRMKHISSFAFREYDPLPCARLLP